MPLNDRDRKALKVGGIVAAVLVVALLGLGQLGKGGSPALPPLSVGPSAATGPTVTGPGVDRTERLRVAVPGRADPEPHLLRPRPVLAAAAVPKTESPGGSTGGGPTGGGPAPDRPAAVPVPRTDRSDGWPRTHGADDAADERLHDRDRRAHGRAHRHVHDQRRVPRHGRGGRHRLQPGRGCDVRGRELRAARRGGQLRHVPLRRRVLHALLRPVEVDGFRSRRSAHGGSGRRRGGGLVSGPPPPHQAPQPVPMMGGCYACSRPGNPTGRRWSRSWRDCRRGGHRSRRRSRESWRVVGTATDEAGGSASRRTGSRSSRASATGRASVRPWRSRSRTWSSRRSTRT